MRTGRKLQGVAAVDVSPVWDGGAALTAVDTWRTMSTDANARGGGPTLGHIIRAVASGTPVVPGGGKVYVYDLNTEISPAHKYAPSVGQVNVRCNDRVHFTRSGGIYVGLRLAPELVALGQSHVAASPGGAWTGPLPASTPSWFTSPPYR